ncbi:MAG: FAD-dependent oxidoreductase [Deltaproteobacteria bacterium]|nr:FAD-dependent oxidoreductase [Deltaproteobacteria bacterium]
MRSNVNIVIKRDICYVCGICIERCILDNIRMYLAPCRAACPIHMNCQGYVRLIASGKEEEAAREIRKYLPFAGIVGRVCTHPCEEQCERRKVDDQAVHIRALKRYLADTLPEVTHESARADQKSGKRAAVVGSGPAGLMAAHDLAVRGHSVTVFDAASEPGGMLRWWIPAFRLPGEEVAHSIKMLETMNVMFQTGRALGKELELEQLEREWDAVFLATGAGSAARLGITGEELDGVHQGLDLLREVREGTPPRFGKSAIVIGGGNTAVDAALTCRKLGVEEVSIVCLEERNSMPAFQTELQEALEEGIAILDCWGPRKISRQNDNRLKVELSRCLRVFDDLGRFCPTLEDACGLAPSAESVVVAIGQRPNHSGIPSELLDETKQSLSADPVTMQTRRPGVFAGGDAVFGPQSVIDAMANGREAALSIDRMLRGETLGWGRAYGDGTCITDFPIDRSGAVPRPRAQLPRVLVDTRDIRTEVEKTLDAKDARAEAERCLNCGYPAEVNQTCWYCLPCEIECPVDALEVRMPYLVR